MPVFKDSQGNVYRVPSSELAQYKLSAEEIANLPADVTVAEQGAHEDDVELQQMQAPRVSTHAHQWYGGD